MRCRGVVDQLVDRGIQSIAGKIPVIPVASARDNLAASLGGRIRDGDRIARWADGIRITQNHQDRYVGSNRRGNGGTRVASDDPKPLDCEPRDMPRRKPPEAEPLAKWHPKRFVGRDGDDPVDSIGLGGGENRHGGAEASSDHDDCRLCGRVETLQQTDQVLDIGITKTRPVRLGITVSP